MSDEIQEDLTELQLAVVGALVRLTREELEWVALLTTMPAPWKAKSKTELARATVRAIWAARDEGDTK